MPQVSAGRVCIAACPIIERICRASVCELCRGCLAYVWSSRRTGEIARLLTCLESGLSPRPMGGWDSGLAFPVCVRRLCPFTAQASRTDRWRARPAECALRTAAAGSCRCGASSSPLPLIAHVGVERLAGIAGRRSSSGGTARRVLISVRFPASCPTRTPAWLAPGRRSWSDGAAQPRVISVHPCAQRGSYAGVDRNGSAVVVGRNCSTLRDSGRPPGPRPALAEAWIPSDWRPPSVGTAQLHLIAVRSPSRCVMPAAGRIARMCRIRCRVISQSHHRFGGPRTCAASSRKSALGCVHRAQRCVTRPGCEASPKTLRWRG